MENLQRDGPDSGTPFEPPTAAERQAVRSERVVLTVSAPVFDGRHAGGDRDGAERPRYAGPELTDEDAAAASESFEPELPWSSLLGQPRNILVLAGGVAAAAVVWLLSGDAGYAFWSGLVAAFLVASQVIDWPSSFSFGQGFVGYRPDPAWPQGVQEDDDVHWNWRPRRGAAGSRLDAAVRPGLLRDGDTIAGSTLVRRESVLVAGSRGVCLARPLGIRGGGAGSHGRAREQLGALAVAGPRDGLDGNGCRSQPGRLAGRLGCAARLGLAVRTGRAVPAHGTRVHRGRRDPARVHVRRRERLARAQLVGGPGRGRLARAPGR